MLMQNIFAEKRSEKLDQVNAQNNGPFYAVVGGQQHDLNPFPNNEKTRKIITNAELEREGDHLAAQGRFDEALAKFYEAMKPEHLNEESDKSGAQGRIIRVHERQGKFDLALKEHEEWFYKAFPSHEPTEDKRLRFLAVIQARDTNSNKPIYGHIQYLREKYKRYIPAQSLDAHSFGMAPINDIIHLYNWMGDADECVNFINEILTSKFLYPNERIEFERVKAAFEEDKRTGQKGHLQKVVESTNYIGW